MTNQESYKLSPLFLVVLVDLIGFGIMLPLLPIYAKLFDASPTQVGMVISCYSIAQFFSAPIWGRLSDIYGRKKILTTTIFLMGLSHIFTAFTPNLTLLFVARFLAGMFAGNVSVASAFMADLTTEQNRTKGMALIGISFGLGFIIGPAIGALFTSGANIQIPYLIAAGLSMLNFVQALTRLPDLKAPSKALKKGFIFSRFYVLFSGNLPTQVILGTFAFFFLTSGIASMETSLPIFLVDEMQVSVRGFGLLMVGFGIIMVLVQGGIVRRLSGRVSDQLLFTLGLSVMCIAFLLLFQASHLNVMVLVFCLLGIGYGLAQPSLQSFVSKGSPKEFLGATMGAYHGLSALARASIPFLAGYLYDIKSYQGAFTLNLLMTFVSLIILQIIWFKKPAKA